MSSRSLECVNDVALTPSGKKCRRNIGEALVLADSRVQEMWRSISRILLLFWGNQPQLGDDPTHET